MLNKYKDEYNKLIAILTEVHNAHMEIVNGGPNLVRLRQLKRKIRQIAPSIKDFKSAIEEVSLEVHRRARGKGYGRDPESIPQETHDWVSKGLGRIRKYDPKTSRKRRNG